MKKLFSVAEAAAYLNVSEQYVRRMLKNNMLSGQRIGKTWVVFMESLRPLKKSSLQELHEDRKSSIPFEKSNINCLSFFSGALGLDLGLEQAGITTLLTSEIDNACRQTIIANRPHVGLIGDIRDYGKKEIFNMAGLSPGDDVDIIVGGPPCQAFSTAGKRKGFEDERGNVFLHFIDLALKIRPKALIIENVRGLLSAPLQHTPHSKRAKGDLPLKNVALRGGALLSILQKLRSGGYGVSFNLYNAANFGAPQIRERVVLLCSRDGTKLPYLTPTHSESGEYSLPKWKTLGEALRTLSPEAHQFIKFPERRLHFYRLLTAGQNWKNLPLELQKEALGKSFYAGGGRTGFFRRLAWDKPAPTLVTHPAMPATDLAHPTEDRPLSIQEYKRIQEFPDCWEVRGSLLDQYRQIGNAVPISLGKAIGKTVVDFFHKNTVVQHGAFKYSRYQNTDDVAWEKSVLSLRNKPIAAKQCLLSE